jgi:SAM-dependent methyltransferase
MLRENQRLIAADIDGEAIVWIANNLPGVEAIKLNDRPPSPVADASVDLVLNHSVFTHLPEELQTLWLDDLRRILKPGGLILATFHGRKTTESFRSRIKEAGFPDQAEDFARTYERDGFIYRAGRSEYESKLPEYYASAFHTIGYVERVWFPGFDCLAWLPEFALGHQDVVILRRH